ncbi:MAG: nodulation protein NfeD [Burkholderiales bacterium]|nr:nodulation protein NfeD [Burkholderiales bacterium]
MRIGVDFRRNRRETMKSFVAALALAWLGLAPGWTSAAPAPIMVVPLTGAIGPAGADFVTRALSRAADEHAQLVVLEIDTPGGLDLSMRQIVKAILASPVPVAAFVAPSGARAASAGTYILYASHVAAMAPGTNLGAATPVNIGAPEATPAPTRNPEKAPAKDSNATPEPSAGESSGQSTMSRKQMHDAAAYIRSLAQLRGRNVAWAERAVREAVSLSAAEALAEHVIDLTARDVPDLVAKLDGRKIETSSGEHVLATRDASLMTIEPDWRTQFLSVITNPSVALLLLVAGAYLLILEFSSPGIALPGVLGAISLLLGLFALQMLPVNYAGLGLLLLGLIFMITELFVPAYGSLAIGGMVAFAFGAVMLIDTDVPGFGVPPALIGAIVVATALFVFVVVGVALKARRRPVITGDDELIGHVGVVLEDAQSEGWIRVRSEQWRVRSPVPLKQGQSVRITGRSDLILSVQPVTEELQGAEYGH